MGRVQACGPKTSCVICGNAKAARETWFSVTEDAELDRVRIWSWQLGFAQGMRAHNICGQRHLRELIVHWMTTGCLNYPFARDPRIGTTKINLVPDTHQDDRPPPAR